MSDGQFRPRSVDIGMKQAKFEVVLDGDMLGEALGLRRRRLDEDILAVEAQAFISDLCGLDLDRPQRLDGVDEDLMYDQSVHGPTGAAC